MKQAVVIVIVMVAGFTADHATAQTSSIGARARRANAGIVQPIAPREAPEQVRNAVYDSYSWVTPPPKAPKTFKVGDLITIIVRERREFEAEAELKTKQKLNMQTELDAFVKFTNGGIGAATFGRGRPGFDLSINNKNQSDADFLREDSLITRLTGQILDVKPNGVLVLEASAKIIHDAEVSTITLTGKCRKEDVTADNTVLSTQLASKTIHVNNEGALRDATKRGWLLRLLDYVKPI